MSIHTHNPYDMYDVTPCCWAQGVNHAYSREERARLKEVESIDYLPPNSAVYRRWLAGQPHRWRSLLHPANSSVHRRWLTWQPPRRRSLPPLLTTCRSTALCSGAAWPGSFKGGVPCSAGCRWPALHEVPSLALDHAQICILACTLA